MIPTSMVWGVVVGVFLAAFRKRITWRAGAVLLLLGALAFALAVGEDADLAVAVGAFFLALANELVGAAIVVGVAALLAVARRQHGRTS